jgi:microcystin-dependent protein
MSDQFVGEVRVFGFNFPPRGWAFCDGQLLSIQQFTALFSLLGTNFGGNGTTNFGLPNFQGAVAMHQGTGPGLSQRQVGETSGSQFVTLTGTAMPAHNHTPLKAFEGRGPRPVLLPAAGDALATSVGDAYAPGTPNASLGPTGVSIVGSSLPHNNMMPSLVLNYCIALTGVFPARN